MQRGSRPSGACLCAVLPVPARRPFSFAAVLALHGCEVGAAFFLTMDGVVFNFNGSHGYLNPSTAFSFVRIVRSAAQRRQGPCSGQTESSAGKNEEIEPLDDFDSHKKLFIQGLIITFSNKSFLRLLCTEYLSA